ncbi:hypothetical protein DFS34DRAFT_576740, partial [Phlyctochytrium arcticum]
FFQTYVREQSKLTASVKGALLKILGKLSRDFPDCADATTMSQLQRIMTQTITTSETKEFDAPHLEGGILGINDFLFREELKFDGKNLCNQAVRILQRLASQTRFAVIRAVLQLLVDHAKDMSESIYEDYRNVYTNVRAASQHGNNDVSRIGYRATDQVLKAVSTQLRMRPDDPEAKKCFWWFMRQFADTLQQDDVKYKEISLAIRGYGFFAGPCKALLEPGQLEILVKQLVGKNAFIMSEMGDERQDFLNNIPSFLEAYASIAAELDHISDDFMMAIETTARLTLTKYPSMLNIYRDLAASALRNLISSLHRKGGAGRSLWSRLAYEAVVLTCTARVDNGGNANAPETFAFEDYLHFWESLFHRTSLERSQNDPIAQKEMDSMLFDETIKAIMQIPANLNLTLTEVEILPPPVSAQLDQGDATTDDATSSTQALVSVAGREGESSLCASNPIDISILTTFAKFCDTFLTQPENDKRFSPWAYMVADKWIELSLRNPLISGFYNLFGVVVGLAGEVEDLSPDATPQQKRLFLLFTNYIHQVLDGLQSYKDELLASCLRSVLASPPTLVALSDLVLPLQTALKLGLSYPPLATIAINCLESWLDALSTDNDSLPAGSEASARLREHWQSNVLQPSFKEILPGLTDYLVHADGDGVGDDGGSSNASASATRPKAQASGPILGKPAIRRGRAPTADDNTGSQLADLRFRIVSLLGAVGGLNRLVVGDPLSTKNTNLLAWDIEKRVFFDIPFKEINCRIFLDDLMPRVMTLAENSPDRKTKVAAAELFHACVIVMIGRSATQMMNVKNATSEAKPTPFHKLYAKIFPGLIRLGIDIDRVVRDLFRPLTFQIIHWLTKNAQAENPETMAMLNACFEGVKDPHGPLREFSAECLAEFLTWSLKQAKPQHQEKNPVNAKSLFKRLYRFLLHADPQKRLGAALTFNKLYRVFREEAHLVNQFSFEILYHLLASIKLADTGTAGSAVPPATKSAIKHIMKIIKVKANMFRSDTGGSRSLRRGFPGLDTCDLGGLADWIFGEIGRIEVEYSQTCMELLMELIPLISSKVPVPLNLCCCLLICVDPAYLRQILEKHSLSIPHREAFHSKKFSNWLRQLGAALSGYTFVTSSRLLTPSAAQQMATSALFPAAIFFVDRVALTSDELDFVPAARLYFNSLRTFTTIKLFDFLDTVLLGESSSASNLDQIDLWNPNFFRLLAVCVFKPDEAGFPIESEEVKQHLPQRVAAIVRRISESVSAAHRRLMIQTMAAHFVLPEANLALSATKHIRYRPALLQAILGLRQLLEAGIVQDVLKACAGTSNDPYTFVKSTLTALTLETDPGIVPIVGNIIEIILQIDDLRQWFFEVINPTVAAKFSSIIDLNGQSIRSKYLVKMVLPGLLGTLITNKKRSQEQCELFLNEVCITIGPKLFAPVELLRLWKMLFQLDPDLVRNSANHEFRFAFSEGYRNILNSCNTLAAKAEAMEILPRILGVKEVDVMLETFLGTMISKEFPLSPHDLTEGTPQYKGYVEVMQTLFNAIENGPGFVVAKALMSHMCRQSNHPFAAAFQRSIMQSVAIQSAEVGDLIGTLFKYLRDETLLIDIRRNIEVQMLAPALHAAPQRETLAAYVQHIQWIMSVLNKDLPKQDYEIRNSLLEKTVAFELIEICYTRLDLKSVHSPEAPVVIAYYGGPGKGGTGKQLSGDLVRLAKVAKNTPIQAEAAHADTAQILKTYHQRAFNALAAVISATQREQLPAFVHQILFSGKDLWANIVDSQTRRSQLSALSSFNEGAGEQLERQSDGTDTRNDQLLLYGHNSCMGWIVRIINILQDMSSTGEKSNDPPAWMRTIIGSINATYAPLNVRAYLASIILNVPQPFAPYTGDLWQAFASILSRIPKMGEFVQDMCLLLLTWAEDTERVVVKKLNEDAKEWRQTQEVVSRMLETLASSAGDAETKPIVRINLGLINSFVEKWSRVIIPPTGVIYRLIRSSEDEKLILSGVNLISVLAENGIPPYNPNGLGSEVATEEKFAEAYITLLSHKKRSVVGYAAEVLGKWLKSGRDTTPDLVSSLKKRLQQKVESLQNVHAANSDSDNFLLILDRLSIGSPDIVKLYAKNLLFMLPRLYGKSRARALFSLSACASDIPDLFADLRAKNLSSLLRKRDDETQGYLLMILLGLAGKLSESEVVYLLGATINTFSEHPSEKCRAAFYALMTRLHERGEISNAMDEGENEQSNTGLSPETHRVIKLAILNGLNDTSDDIRDAITTYFGQEGRMGKTDVFSRTSYLLQSLYEPEVETSYLNFSTFFLLEASKSSPVYNANLFDSGLPDATFQDAVIRTDLSLLGAGSMQPLYAATQGATFRPTQGGHSGRIADHPVNMTQGAQWSATLDPNMTAAQARNTFARSDSGLASAFAGGDSDSSFAGDVSLRSLSQVRRTQQGSLSDRTYRVSQAEHHTRAKAKHELIQKVSRARAVTLARKYRIGELPDIQIQIKEIIDPLQKLASRDGEVGREVFSSLIISIYEQVDNSEPESDAEYRTGIENSLNNILTESVQLYPPLIATVLSILLKLPSHQCTPSAISRASEGSSNNALGILLLEKLASSIGTHSQPSAKRSRTSRTTIKSQPVEFWTQLANLYRSMNKADVYRPLYYSKVSRNQDLKEAIAAELDGQYDRALQAYKAAQSAEDTLADHEANLCHKGIAESLETTSHKKLLESNHGKDLGIALLANGDTLRAAQCIKKAQQTFLASFANTSSLASEHRLQQLSQLQPISEMEMYMRIRHDVSEATRISHLKQFRNQYPSLSLDPIDTWQDLALVREIVAGNLIAPEFSDQEIAVDVEATHKMVAKAARKQGNLYVARHYLTPTAPTNSFDPIHTYSTIRLSYESMKSMEYPEMVDLAGKIGHNLYYYQSEIAELESAQAVKFKNLEGQLYEFLTQSVCENDALASLILQNKTLMKAFKRAGFQITDGNLLQLLPQITFKLFVEVVENTPKDKYQLQLARFCDNILQILESDPEKIRLLPVTPAAFATTAVRNILHVMGHGNQEAIERFPRLLQLIEIHLESTAEFKTLTAELPAWTFLRWLPQVTALLDKPIAPSLHQMLENIAADYPQALYYPLSISSEQYSFGTDPVSSLCRKHVDRIKHVVRSPLLEKLTLELRRLTEPSHAFKDWIDKCATFFQSTPSQEHRKILLDSFQEMRAICLGADADGGPIGKAFGSKYAQKIYKYCGTDGGKFSQMSPAAWKEFQKMCQQQIHGKENMRSGLVPLKQYSPWLASFDASSYEEDLEIPGQYSGDQKPRPEDHVKILRFQEQVLVMSSMRRPKRLVILGSDEREHPWLVKGGEDMRLDQRVQQMFSIMNHLISKNRHCAESGLTLRTYKVIPMSTSLGILEWVDNTKPLRDVMNSIPGFQEEYARSDALHNKFVESHKGSARNLGDSNLNSHQAYLRTWMQKLAASPEAYLAIRATFAKSLATLNICSYLLGIGDRHSENFLVDMGSGQVIGIDFGHAFGSATEVLPIPELVPFRLTQQLSLAMEPLGVPVLLEYPMTLALTALREKKEVLLNALNIFIKEPLIEWRKFALNQASKQGKLRCIDKSCTPDSDEASLNPPEWYPQQKLNIARRKLLGHNPADITAQELQWGHGDKPWFSAANAVLAGDPARNKRARVGRVCATVKEQVECLIDQATDPNILGRAWRGWGPWC